MALWTMSLSDPGAVAPDMRFASHSIRSAPLSL